MAELPDLTCEVCQKEPAVGVASMPGVPYSAAYGAECLAANAHPYWAVVANTAMCGSRAETAEWWQGIIEDTCRHLGKTLEEFDAEVAIDSAAYEEHMREEGVRTEVTPPTEMDLTWDDE